MVTVAQVQKGFARFVDNHVAAAYTGIERIAVAGVAGLISAKLPEIIAGYAQRPVVGYLGLYEPESGTVDIDALYNAFVPQMGAEKLPIKLPTVGAMNLGTIKIGKSEIDTLVRYIREA